MSNVVFAHQPDLSNIIISKTANGQIILQINSSLTAFQQEVNYLNGEGAYKSPKEFRDLVLKHFKTSFYFIVNKKDTLQFKNPKVFLGHETKLVAEIIGLPDSIQTIHLKNELFKDIHNNQSVVIFLLDAFPKEKYFLDLKNNHEIHIELQNELWKKVDLKQTTFKSNYIMYTALLLIICLLLFFIVKKRKAKTTTSL
ncbi:hypothetical protein [Cellulophaga sp. L1A9]|uniref:hypothetical protein n=1 Tax=Cellulophaga sp. L1A9 TaxID=2686362 RepID=UPI00131E5D72|nr:hypothetical protein [Cellulophaga sp. L1A9]